MMRDYYTIKEAAYLLGVGESTIRAWISTGQIRAYPVINKTKKEWDFNDIPGTLYGNNFCYAIPAASLDNVNPDYRMLIGKRNLVRDQQELDEYLDYLDKRYADLCSELDEIGKIQNHLREIKPYL